MSKRKRCAARIWKPIVGWNAQCFRFSANGDLCHQHARIEDQGKTVERVRTRRPAKGDERMKCRGTNCKRKAVRWYGWAAANGDAVKAPFCLGCRKVIVALGTKLIPLRKCE